MIRIVMWLCFSTAFLYMALYWRITSSMTANTVEKTVPQENLVAENINSSMPNFEDRTAFEIKSLLTKGSAQPKSTNNLAAANQLQVVVDLSDRRVYVYQANTAIASYPIGVGKKGWETPHGTFKVLHKRPNPVWQHPITGRIFPGGADSPLGERWIGFWTDGRNEIGFHGTPDEELVGSPVSHGCLRMRNSDIRLLYKQVSLGTQVSVRQ